MAVLSLVFAFVFAPLGLILGLLAVSQMNRQPGRYVGKGVAIVGAVISAIGVLVLCIAVGLFLRAGSEVRRLGPLAAGQQYRPYTETGAKYQCLSNMKNVAMAAEMWADDHSGKLPTADRWVDGLLSLVGDPAAFRCSRDTSAGRSSYAMNAALSGADIKTLRDPARVVLFYETAHPGSNPAGGPEDVAPSRHEGKRLFGFVDGSARAVGPEEQVSFSAQ